MPTLRLTAFRAEFSEKTRTTFEEILSSIESHLPMHQDRIHTSSAAEKNTILSKFISHPHNSGIGAVLSLFEPGSTVSTLDFQNSPNSVTHDTQGAEAGSEYLDRDFSLLAVENLVIGCAFGKRANFIAAVLHSLAVKAHAIPNGQIFNFVRIPRKDTWEQIQKYGVKKVKLDATMLLGDAHDTLADPTLARLFGSKNTAETLKRRRQNVATLSISTSKKFQKHFVPGVEIEEQDKNIWLDSVASTVLNDKRIDDYTIILNNNRPIQSGTLLVEESVSVAANGSSYDTKDAHQKMLEFYRSISQDYC
ncbi:hypothetical protein [Phaeobacter inhibens]|uniref:hypothetical protein n=1 Tax=Phaeobacter inhibens TaxID=221822 RepID=UPI000CA25CDA|nr:hypothetical protein [Phaeobacter inhibens]AUR12893.1 hypothetical protein PhaeoP48_02931 [Phaeobacter inhibens]UWR87011.1 hypothetical protein K4L01_09475 [Phaeobacter inhibens]